MAVSMAFPRRLPRRNMRTRARVCAPRSLVLIVRSMQDAGLIVTWRRRRALNTEAEHEQRAKNASGDL